MLEFIGIYQQQDVAVGGGPADPPTVISVTPSEVTSGTTHNISLGATVTAGDLLLIIAAADDVDDPSTTAADWTKIQSFNDTSKTGGAIFKKLADGSEGGTTINITTPSTESLSTQCYRIQTWSGNIADVAFAATPLFGTENAATHPTLTSGFGAVPTLWICAMISSRTGTPSSDPANYTVTRNGTSNTANTQVNSGWRQLTAATETPGQFVWPSGNDWATTTLAVRGTG